MPLTDTEEGILTQRRQGVVDGDTRVDVSSKALNLLKLIVSRENILSSEFVMFTFSMAILGVQLVYFIAGLPGGPLSTLFISEWLMSAELGAAFILIASTNGIVIGVLRSENMVSNIVKHLSGVLGVSIATYMLVYSVNLDVTGFKLLSHILKASLFATAVYLIFAQFVDAAVDATKESALRKLRVAQIALSLFVSVSSILWFLNLTGNIAATYDISVVKIESAFGVRVPAVLRSVARANNLTVFLEWIYLTTPAVVVIHDILLNRGMRWTITKMTMISAAIGFTLYTITPAAGTAFLFNNYNDLTAPLVIDRDFLTDVTSPRNAMPSLHATWGLFLIIAGIANFAVGARKILVASSSILFGLLIVITALVCGEHYLLDVVVAIPFALTLYILLDATNKSGAKQVFLFAPLGGLLTALWVLMIRMELRFDFRPISIYIMTLATLIYAVGVAYSLKPTISGYGLDS